MSGNLATSTSTKMSTEDDFDFTNTCRFFKSSFARTLSLNNGSSSNNNNCCSLEFDIVYQQQHDNTNDFITTTNNSHHGKRLISGGNGGGWLKQQQDQQRQNMVIDVKNGVVTCNNIEKNDNIKTTTAAINQTNNKNIDQYMNMSAVNDHQKQQHQQHQQQHQQQQQPQQQLGQHMMSVHLKPTDCSKICKYSANATLIKTTLATTNSNGGQWQAIHQDQPNMPPLDTNIEFNNGNVINNNNNNSATNCKHRNLWSRDNNSSTKNCNFMAAVSAKDATTTRAMDTKQKMTSGMIHNYNINNKNKSGSVKTKSLTVGEGSSNTVNVEKVLLRNQVDTLQWQLKQVETSCEMYRVVMEEVSRFLERYQTQKQQQRLSNQNIMEQQQQQIPRSKSLYQVYGGASTAGVCHENQIHPTLSEDEAPISYARARSSTNLIDLNVKAVSNLPSTAIIDHNSYSAFKDFTWRRSPRKPNAINGAQNGLDSVEEKLCQEAFRLARTIQNLLQTSTKQPDLTQHRHSLSSRSMGRLGKAMAIEPPTNSESEHIVAPLVTSQDANAQPNTNKNALSSVADILFMRSHNMRDSRLSVRSSTDSSVHSTTSSASSSSCASSKLEADEDTMVHGVKQPIQQSSGTTGGNGGSTTEDESGFSSINSFQDIGVPAFSSTLIERKTSLKEAMRPKSHPNNVLGLPDTPTHVWGVPSIPAKTSYHDANKFHRFSTLSTEEAGTVLWV